MPCPPRTSPPPALLKQDVQGFELQALAGCEEVLERFAWVYAECSFQALYAGQSFADEVIAWLRERGLRLEGVYPMAYDERGRAVQADFLFGPWRYGAGVDRARGRRSYGLDLLRGNLLLTAARKRVIVGVVRAPEFCG
ncbi:MAG: FkbM family methyltransferase [Pseudomonadota bacterium]